jgi:putative ABC transport system permease protein
LLCVTNEVWKGEIAVKFPLWRHKQQEQLKDEIQSHLEMAAQDRIERGESRELAESSARREFGNVGLVEHVTRDQWGWRWLEEFSQDLRYGARTLRKNPGFTAIAVLTLALGIGANTSLFSVVNGVLLNPLPYPHPEQLLTLHESKPNFKTGSISYPNFRDWQKDNHTFSSMAIDRAYSFSLTGLGEAEQLNARFISSDFFPLLAVNPVLGRMFAAGEDEIGAAPLAMISAGFWKRKFAAAPGVLGKTLTLDGRDYTIIGIVPASFDLFLRSFRPAEVYVGVGQWSNPALPQRGAGLGIHGIGRLKPGVTLEQARADMDGVTQNLTAAYPDADKGISANLIPLREDMLGDVQPVLSVLLGAVGFVLLIACVNVANLLLARSNGRSREFAVRAALGAGQGRLVRQLLTESILLALAGGGLGLLLAQWGTRAALAALPTDLPRSAEIRLDSHVLFFTMGVSLLAGVFFGLAPALKTSQPRLHETLKESGRGASGTRHRAQGVFVVLETAMALVLLIGAGLMIRSLTALWRVDPGFHPNNVLTFNLSLPPAMMTTSPDAVRAAIRNLDERFASIPGVQFVSQSWGGFPFSYDDDLRFWMDGQPKPTSENDLNWALAYIVSPSYLQVMGIPLQRGRFFTAHDDEHAAPVVVIDDVLARKYFGDQDPVGKRINVERTNDKAEIIGVVGHVNQWGLDLDATQALRAQMYVPCLQMPDSYIAMVPGGGGTFVVVRSETPTAELVASFRRTSQQISGQQVVHDVETMNDLISDSLATRRFSVILLGAFAALAFLLSSVGIYGVVSYLVGQRTREIGIRMALGAGRADVVRLVLSHGVKMALVGIVIGLLASLGLTRLIANMIYGVSPTDPLTFLGVAMVLTLVALAACYVPARRAMRVDPMVALRYE